MPPRLPRAGHVVAAAALVGVVGGVVGGPLAGLAAGPVSASAGTSVRTGGTPVVAPLHRVNGTYYRSVALVTPPPRIQARAWAVADMDTGQVIATHGRHDELPQASTIKLLTAVTASRLVPDYPTHRVTRSEAHPASCSCAGLVVGRRYSREALLAGMLLPSGNDAAEAVAGSAPGGHAAFIAAMNAEAVALGARNTWVVTPSGLTALGAYSSAYDLLVFLRAAEADPVVDPVLKLPTYRFGPVTGRRHLVFRATDYVNTYAGSLGKSGYTTPAKNTLVVDTLIAGHHLGVATLGAPGGHSTKGARRLTVWASRNLPALAALESLPAAPGPLLR